MIHDTAIIDPAARLHESVEVGPYSIIGADVEIDEGCWIGPHVVINGPTKIGKRNRFYQFSSIGEVPQDLKFSGGRTTLEVGDDNTFREFVTLNRGTIEGGGVTRIGSHNLLMAYSHVAHDCLVGDHVIFANAASLAGHVSVGDYAILGGFTSVHQFSAIGDHSFTGLGTVVNRDVPPFVMAAGNHAKAFGINKNGLKRRGFSAEVIAALHKSFRLLIKSRSNRENAQAVLAELRQQHSEVDQLVSFIESSERGVVR